ncbi:hypothetical protein BaRGS_00010839, partial [Batillaria attramentaria]
NCNFMGDPYRIPHISESNVEGESSPCDTEPIDVNEPYWHLASHWLLTESSIGVASCMTRNCFLEIMKYFYTSDNGILDGTDKLATLIMF